ncbi:hypothetical protein AVEN_117156-1 [Araneus ventricosus]|uniref:Uncharacterized protein n=1 Tax=Araneus ventricosus TaxID=182803 RepID=A0A4Y2AZW1_ARAVE|nr:hypothetical protein AVEN_117156-1 [Araneus ventricosus]
MSSAAEGESQHPQSRGNLSAASENMDGFLEKALNYEQELQTLINQTGLAEDTKNELSKPFIHRHSYTSLDCLRAFWRHSSIRKGWSIDCGVCLFPWMVEPLCSPGGIFPFLT